MTTSVEDRIAAAVLVAIHMPDKVHAPSRPSAREEMSDRARRQQTALVRKRHRRGWAAM